MLRVIAGQAKGLRLNTLSGNKTRPTTDRVKESLFNILAPYLYGATVLDLFSGTGNLAIEALSRGASYAYFTDSNVECCDIIKGNLQHTKLQDKAEVIHADFEAAITKLSKDNKKFDLIFLDPPYSKGFINLSLNKINEFNIIKIEGIIIAEKKIDDIIPETEGNLTLVRRQKYGDTEICFYVNRLPSETKD